MKKIAALIGAGALLLSVAGTAFAKVPEVEDNWAKVDNGATATAVSGDNTQGGYVLVSGKKADVDGLIKVSGDNTMTTGRARAKASAKVTANSIVDCGTCGKGEVEDNDANVTNDAVADARSGNNGQGGSVLVTGNKADVDGVKVIGNNSLTTHSARAKSRTFVVVNSILSD